MKTKVVLDTPKGFDFKMAVTAHGWSSLRPFEFDESAGVLHHAFHLNGGKPLNVSVSAEKSGLKIEVADKKLGAKDQLAVSSSIKHMLRMDEPLDEFYTLVEKEDRLRWIKRRKAGRLLRSPSVFEDLVKTVCTTNCTWALTKIMTGNLVELLGAKTPNGKKAFPTPEAMAALNEKFYRDEIKSGYRSPFLQEIAEQVAAGKLKPEQWLESDLPTAELKKQIKAVKGVGDYAADNLLKLLGRYDGLALDSWLRAAFYKKHNRGKKCADAKIEKFYRSYGKWKGLVIWCDLCQDELA
jgi:N-glycosylase/DNA lyase